MRHALPKPRSAAARLAMLFWVMAGFALASWIGLTIYGHESAIWMKVARPLVALAGVGAAFLGTVLPLFGFQMEIASGRHQNAIWRRALLKERIEAREIGYGSRRIAETVSQERGLPAVLESPEESVSEPQGAAVG